MPPRESPPLTRGVVLRGFLLAIAIALSAVAAWLIVTSHTQKRIELGVLAGLWAAIVAGFAMFDARRLAHPGEAHAAPAPSTELELRTTRLEIERAEEAAARRAHEARLEHLIRSEMHAAISNEVAALRSEIADLRSELLEKVGGQLRLERIETTRVIGSDLEALQHEVRQLKAVAAAELTDTELAAASRMRMGETTPVRQIVEPARVRPVSRETAEIEADIQSQPVYRASAPDPFDVASPARLENVRPAESVRHEEPGRPAESARQAEPVRPAEWESVRPAEPVRPAESTAPSRLGPPLAPVPQPFGGPTAPGAPHRTAFGPPAEVGGPAPTREPSEPNLPAPAESPDPAFDAPAPTFSAPPLPPESPTLTFSSPSPFEGPASAPASAAASAPAVASAPAPGSSASPAAGSPSAPGSASPSGVASASSAAAAAPQPAPQPAPRPTPPPDTREPRPLPTPPSPEDEFAGLPRIRPFTDFELDPIEPPEPPVHPTPRAHTEPAGRQAGAFAGPDESPYTGRRRRSDPDEVRNGRHSLGEEAVRRHRRAEDDAADDVLARLLAREASR